MLKRIALILSLLGLLTLVAASTASADTTPQGGALAGKLVFMDASGGNIYTVNGDGTGLQRVTTGLDPAWYDPFNFIGDRRYPSKDYNPLILMTPQYSPDGKSIVYMVYQQPTWQIAVANADGSNQHLLTQQDPLDFSFPSNVSPVWSPDGKQILFLSNRNGKWEFFVMNADGTGQQQVLKNISDHITLTYNFQSERMVNWTSTPQ